jgi:hypothetical protein
MRKKYNLLLLCVIILELTGCGTTNSLLLKEFKNNDSLDNMFSFSDVLLSIDKKSENYEKFKKQFIFKDTVPIELIDKCDGYLKGGILYKDSNGFERYSNCMKESGYEVRRIPSLGLFQLYGNSFIGENYSGMFSFADIGSYYAFTSGGNFITRNYLYQYFGLIENEDKAELLWYGSYTNQESIKNSMKNAKYETIIGLVNLYKKVLDQYNIPYQDVYNNSKK